MYKLTMHHAYLRTKPCKQTTMRPTLSKTSKTKTMQTTKTPINRQNKHNRQYYGGARTMQHFL